MKLEVTPKQLAVMVADGMKAKWKTKDTVKFVKELDREVAALDFVIPLYKHFKYWVEKESPEDL